MKTLTLDMKLKSSKTGTTYTIELINKVNNKIYLKCDKEEVESHNFKKVIELIENGYYTVIEKNIIPFNEEGECIHFKKFSMCELSGKRCNINSEYNYNTKKWTKGCREFTENIYDKI